MWQESWDKREAVHRLHSAAVAEEARVAVSAQRAKFKSAVDILQSRAQRQTATASVRQQFQSWKAYADRQRSIRAMINQMTAQRQQRAVMRALMAWREMVREQKVNFHHARLAEMHRTRAVLRVSFAKWRNVTVNTRYSAQVSLLLIQKHAGTVGRGGA